MKFFNKFFFIFLSCFILIKTANKDISAETNTNSIIKLFCLENIKDEMAQANISYDENMANYTCDCYLEEFFQNKNHKKSIEICKLESKEKFNL